MEDDGRERFHISLKTIQRKEKRKEPDKWEMDVLIFSLRLSETCPEVCERMLCLSSVISTIGQ